ncbi:MAG: U32 family peptidase [Bacteroidaceae bacterium]|nr:U32 family peptidase [Bacteroidaceae bacterium]
MSRTSIELLAPARNLECGRAAIDHGADAVYIGAPRFGARAAAGNSVEDIAQLCQYAHPYGVRIYVTLNTILYNPELVEVEALIWSLYRAGVDALIVQDMALHEMHLPPIPLHASTQMDNRTPEQVRWLAALGYEQVVLARELSLPEIRRIHEAVPEVRLEAFVHGALCVSLSGRCYASQSCFERSANRGECAQFCRLPFSLEDDEGHTILRDKHLLSLRDMNRSSDLEEMLDAGVVSFKIEGRLKDVAYVKNITAHYRLQLDSILSRRTEYVRASEGEQRLTFSPDPQRSFSRGFTDYFLHGRKPGMASMDTPKSCGPVVGMVKEVRGHSIVVSGTASFSNGDGLCYLDRQGQLQGFRINRAEGNHLFPAQMPDLERGTILRRSYDQQWESSMARTTAKRRIPLMWTLDETPQGFALTAKASGGQTVTLDFSLEHQLARTDQTPSIKDTLSRLGDTPFVSTGVDIHFTAPWFIPRSILVDWRRMVIKKLGTRPSAPTSTPPKSTLISARQHALPPQGTHPSAPNVSNRLARQFYKRYGIAIEEPALEVQPPEEAKRRGTALMRCRYCIRYELGLCRRQQLAPNAIQQTTPDSRQQASDSRLQASDSRQQASDSRLEPVSASNDKRNAPPLFLVSQDGRRFRLDFDCAHCQMVVRHD